MTSHRTPSDIVSDRVRQVRRKRGMTMADLAERCTNLGMPHLSVSAISNIETGRRDKKTGRRRRDVTVDELLVLAAALNVSPVNLLVPPDAGLTVYPFSPIRMDAAREVRDWMRGFTVLPGGDVRLHLAESPPEDYYEDGGLLQPRWRYISDDELPQWVTSRG
jgi:transcriptional regulator with XRE-family HTH domain